VSAIIKCVDGVILNYGDPSELRSHHTEQRRRVSDADRIALVEAEREFRALALLVECMDIAEYGRNRIYLGLSRLQRLQDIARRYVEIGAARIGEAT
jgi:hypothetical protein